MPIIKNFSRATVVLEHVTAEPIVLKPSQTVEVPAEALSLPLIRHYIEIKKLGLLSQRPTITSVTLSRWRPALPNHLAKSFLAFSPIFPKNDYGAVVGENILSWFYNLIFKCLFQALMAHPLLICNSNEVSTNTHGTDYGGKAQSNT